MMIRRYMALLTAALALTLTLTGCPTDADDDGNQSGALYKVIVDGLSDGSLTVSPSAALAGGVQAGTVITLAVQPAPNYALEELLINDGTVTPGVEEEGQFTFSINGDVQVSARFNVLDRIPIGSGEDLAKIGKDPAYPLSGHYYLTGDIDLATFDPWTPIGTSIVADYYSDDESNKYLYFKYFYTGKEFTGVFDGADHTIQNLRLNGAAPYAGLFGHAQFATIKNVTIHLAEGDITLSGGKQFAGAVAGFAVGTDISRVTVANGLILRGGHDIFAGAIAGCALHSAPEALAGAGDLDVSGSGHIYAGGLFGYAGFSPLGSEHTATGAVKALTSGGVAYAGGVAGYALSSPIGSGTYGENPVLVESGGYSCGGGIVGYARDSALALGGTTVGRSVTAKGVIQNVYGGGIVGYALSSPISKATATGAVTLVATGSATLYGGGIAGYLASSPVSESTASGEVSVSGSSNAYAGGLVGYGNSVSGSSATGTVRVESGGSGSCFAGGLVGNTITSSGAIITRSFARGDVFAIHSSASNAAYAGGLVGSSYVPITESYATGAVSATSSANAYAGGLVGQASSNSISDCYATGDVEGEGPNVRAGGLAGSISVVVSRCYAEGTVTGNMTNTVATNNGAGGLVGVTSNSANTQIEYSVAWGPSVVISGDAELVGRVNGSKGGSAALTGNAALDTMTLANNSDTEVAPTNDEDGKDGKSMAIADLQNPDTYDPVDDGGLGWDFVETWKWVNNRPVLRWQQQ
jgi:hypothetical protein